ncbi:MAG: IS4 family transposase, partial [Holosporales bacterium]|nr:IS4 family transposase [Holosporales bacterium]
MFITYIARVDPELPCDALFDEQEWKVLYCAANRTKKPPDEPYSIADAVKFLSWLGGPKQSPSDDPPGVKLIWLGLNNLHV